MLESRDQLLRTLRDECGDVTPVAERDEAFLRAVFDAYAVRLARRRGPNDRRAVTADALVRIASGVRREWLDPARFTTRHELEYDDGADRLIARKRTATTT